MQKKNIIYGLTIFLFLLVIFVFRELPIKVETVPATVSLPRITWINSKADTERFVQTQVHISNDTGVTLICPEKKPVFPTEDILCMKPPRYSPSYRNPCWYPDDSDKLSCLPYFLQIGMSKCATTDLFSRLIAHPDIIPLSGANGKNKSITWWNLRLTGSTWQPPYSGGKRENFKQYSEYFSNAAKVIESNKDQTGYHGKVTGEGSPTYLWMLYLWNRIPQNTYLTKPKVLVPHLIRHVLPKTKFIVTLRDPIESDVVTSRNEEIRIVVNENQEQDKGRQTVRTNVKCNERNVIQSLRSVHQNVTTTTERSLLRVVKGVLRGICTTHAEKKGGWLIIVYKLFNIFTCRINS
ncbi:CHST15 [Mytilus edulis]|uniref:CHST15 n=1 Tax=Mytilus edulis TaxID=6550 RepID=A0A8S3STH3_MYTED|nr:CHST15 [Mytilus edulis]